MWGVRIGLPDVVYATAKVRPRRDSVFANAYPALTCRAFMYCHFGAGALNRKCACELLNTSGGNRMAALNQI